MGYKYVYNILTGEHGKGIYFFLCLNIQLLSVFSKSVLIGGDYAALHQVSVWEHKTYTSLWVVYIP